MSWLALCLCVAGCQSTSNSSGFGRADVIRELHLFVLPVPLTAKPGGPAEGIGVRVFASSAERATGVSVRDGKLEILVFDSATAEGVERPQPARVWTYSSGDLAKLARSGPIGQGYELPLRWTGPRPTGERLSVIARYTPKSGPAVLSVPSVVLNSLR